MEPEESLDPTDWSAMRDLGHRMVDDMFDYLATVRQRPAWRSAPADVREHFNSPLPVDPQNPEKVYEEFLQLVLPYSMGNTHPRFWAWVIGSGTPLGALAEFLAATMNPNVGGGDHVANLVETQVLTWCKEMLGYPAQASGLLVSGGSMANLIGLTVARNTKAGFDVRHEGVQSSSNPLVLYGSTETHSSVQKAVETLGLGGRAFRRVPVNDAFQIDVGALRAAVARDRREGCRPICVVGNAGTVNTGAIDDLETLADICAMEDLWFHVDGAFGALAYLCPDLRPLLGGMGRADSLAFDLHKWMHMPYEIGCALVRNEEDHLAAFELIPEYLAHGDRGVAAGDRWFSDYGIQLSRGFRALKAWMSLKEHGAEKYGRSIRQNVAQAEYLSLQIDESSTLERLAPTSLNIVCFRYSPQGVPEPDVDRLNREILARLQESGVAVPSATVLLGRFAMRVAITNHRTTRADLDLLVQEVSRIGADLLGGR